MQGFPSSSSEAWLPDSMMRQTFLNLGLKHLESDGFNFSPPPPVFHHFGWRFIGSTGPWALEPCCIVHGKRDGSTSHLVCDLRAPTLSPGWAKRIWKNPTEIVAKLCFTHCIQYNWLFYLFDLFGGCYIYTGRITSPMVFPSPAACSSGTLLGGGLAKSHGRKG